MRITIQVLFMIHSLTYSSYKFLFHVMYLNLHVPQ